MFYRETETCLQTKLGELDDGFLPVPLWIYRNVADHAGASSLAQRRHTRADIVLGVSEEALQRAIRAQAPSLVAQ